MNKLFLAAALVFVSSVVHAQGMPSAQLYLSPAGVDAGDCQTMPCRTPPYVASQVLAGHITAISVADGYYPYAGTANIFYYSPVNWIGNVAHPENVIFTKTDSGECFIRFQDDSIGGVQGISFQAGASGQTAICSRQHTIVDFLALRFGGGPNILQGFIYSVDYGINSCLGTIYVDQSISSAAFMLNNAKLNLNCHVELPAEMYIPFFVLGVGGSRIDARSATFGGGGQGTATHGVPYNLDGLTLLQLSGVTLPGDSPMAPTNGSIVQ